MQCTAILKSGRRCSRSAPPGSRTCAQHDPSRPPPRSRPFYADHLSAEDQRALKRAQQVDDDLSQEIALLRLLIRERAAAGDLDSVRRATDALARLIRQQQRSLRPAANALDQLLEEALDQLAADERPRRP